MMTIRLKKDDAGNIPDTEEGALSPEVKGITTTTYYGARTGDATAVTADNQGFDPERASTPATPKR
jgi:hypothetical protein